MKKKKKGKKELVVMGEEEVTLTREERLETYHFADIKSPQKRRWLATQAKTGRIGETAKLTGISTALFYIWKRKDDEFAVAVDFAMQIAGDAAEDEIHRRAFTGYDKPVTYKGKIKSWYKEYSDLLAIFWMKGAKPEKYRDNLVGLTSNAPVAIQINLGAAPESNDKGSLNKLGEDADEPNK